MMTERLTFEEYLEQNGTLTYSNVGVSMLPLLRQGKDLFTVEKTNGRRLKKGDVVLYRRRSGRAENGVEYVLHRIIRVTENGYVILGDNCINKEYGIADSDILGRMTSVTRNGRTLSADSFPLRAYGALWVGITPVRVLFKRAVLFAKRSAKKISRCFK